MQLQLLTLKLCRKIKKIQYYKSQLSSHWRLPLVICRSSYVPATPSEESLEKPHPTLWKPPLCRKRRGDQAKNQMEVSTEHTAWNQHTQQEGRRELNIQVPNTNLSHVDIHCLLCHATGVRGLWQHALPTSLRNSNIWTPHYSSHHKEHTPIRVEGCSDCPPESPALPK